jgi:hypothetical protein
MLSTCSTMLSAFSAVLFAAFGITLHLLLL